MRLYALLIVAAAVVYARAATIPTETEKKINTGPETSDKVPDNTSSEQELLDQTNTIKDVENKLRVKPEDIPVAVIVEDPQPVLKTDDKMKDSEEITLEQPGPDLRNPGLPQHQEHETQNPEYYESEQQTVLIFKQSINDAQNILRQGFQGITEGIQNMLRNNEPVQTIQNSIQSLRQSFTTQISKLNGTIQQFLNTESSSNTEPAIEQTKASLNQIEKGLNSLRNDFNRGVKDLAQGVEIVASLKAETPEIAGSTAAPASSSPAPAGNPFVQVIQSMQTTFSDTLRNITQSINNIFPNPFNQASSTTAPAPAGVQSDTQVPSATPSAPSATNLWQSFTAQLSQWQNQTQGLLPQPGQLGSGSGPLITAIQNNPIINQIASVFQINRPGAQPAQPAPATQPAPPAESDSKPAETISKPEENPVAQAAEPAAPSQAAAITPAGPIRQILQKNPISQGIAGAVQRLQNINNPEKPREVEKVEEQKTEEVKKPDEDKPENLSQKGSHGINNVSRIENNEAMKKEKLPESQAPKEEEMKEQKTVEVADKTE